MPGAAGLEEFTYCPACGAIAELHDEYVEQSTDGPVLHQVIHCSQRHICHDYQAI